MKSDREILEDIEDVLDQIETYEDTIKTEAAQLGVSPYEVEWPNGMRPMLQILRDRVRAYHAMATIREVMERNAG